MMADQPKPINLTDEQIDEFVKNTKKWIKDNPESNKPIPEGRLNRSMNILSGKKDWRDPMEKRSLRLPPTPEEDNKGEE